LIKAFIWHILYLKGAIAMRKTLIIGLFAAVLMSACSGKPITHTESRQPAANTQPSRTEDEDMKDLQARADALDEVVEEGKKAIQTEVSKGIAAIQAKATTTTQATTTTMQKPKAISLDVKTVRGEGTLTFIKVETNPQKNEIIFYYETSDEKAVMPNSRETSLQDKNGAKYISVGGGGVGNSGKIHFNNITDFSDLSTVTLTYAFEGFDPVTVTFDIPGI
jgi:lysyl-tRNA synthetase class II